MEEKKFLVIDNALATRGEEFVSVYDTEAEALAAGERDWNQLTPAERKRRSIMVAYVTRSDLADCADDDGETDWTAYAQAWEVKTFSAE